MGNKLTMKGKVVASMIIFLSLASIGVAKDYCDVVLKVDSNGVSPTSFSVGHLYSIVCVQNQYGEQVDISIWQRNDCRTFDYNVSLFTRSGECEVRGPWVDKETGKRISEHRCNYKPSDKDAKMCRYVTKPNLMTNSRQYYVFYMARGNPSFDVLYDLLSEGDITYSAPFKLNLPKFLKGSKDTLLLALRRKPDPQPSHSFVYSIMDNIVYYLNYSLSDRPANGQIGDYQDEDHGKYVKYSDPDIQCVPLDGVSCTCTVKERSFISILESRKHDFPKMEYFGLVWSDGVPADQRNTKEYTVEVNLVSPNPDQRMEQVEKEEL